MRSMLAVLLGLLTATAAGAAEPDFAALTRDFLRALDRRDQPATLAAYCPGAVFVRPDGVLGDPSRQPSAQQATQGTATVARSFGQVQVRRVGNAAVVVADSRVRGAFGEAATQLTALWLNAGAKPCLAMLQRAPGGAAAVAATWDEAFQVSDTINRKPNSWLAGAVAGVAPGRALDIASGEGRNALFLAAKGWAVTAVDVSAEGLRMTNEAAARAGTTVTTVRQDVFTYDFGRGGWDAVLFLYAPVRGLERKAFDGLKPGGMVVAEAFLNADAKRADQGVFWGEGEMRRLFEGAGFQVARYDERAGVADYGGQSVPLVRMVAVKP